MDRAATQPPADVRVLAAPEADDEPPEAGEQLGDGIIDRLDRLQRRITPVAFVFGVVKKFGEDRAGHLAALVAYYSFFSVFPLLLVLTTILGFVLSGNPDLQREISDTAVAQIPAVGPRAIEGELQGSGLALGLGLAGALWAGMAAMLAAQNAMNEVWDVPMHRRPNFIESRIRALVMLVVLGFGLVSSIAVAQVGRQIDSITGFGQLGIDIGSALLNILVVGVAFQALTDRRLTLREIAPGAVIAGVGYFLLQFFGGQLVERASGGNDAYGVFAAVIGLLTWFFVLAQVTIVSVLVNVVLTRRLWPRSLSGKAFTDADRRAFARYAEQARRHEDMEVDVALRRDDG